MASITAAKRSAETGPAGTTVGAPRTRGIHHLAPRALEGAREQQFNELCAIGAVGCCEALQRSLWVHQATR